MGCYYSRKISLKTVSNTNETTLQSCRFYVVYQVQIDLMSWNLRTGSVITQGVDES